MADKFEISRSSVAKQMADLKNQRIKNRMGSDK
jgi:biotin operon repressor